MKEKYLSNIKNLIWYLGGRKKVSELFEKNFTGLYDPLPENTIKNWVQNNSMPFYRLPQLIHLGDVIGKPVELHDFLEKKKATK